MRQAIKLEFDYWCEEVVFVPVQENIDYHNKHAMCTDIVKTGKELADLWSNMDWGGGEYCKASIVNIFKDENETGFANKQQELFQDLPAPHPNILGIENEEDTVICNEFDIVCYKELALHIEMFHTPFDKKPVDYYFCSYFALDCSRGDVYTKDYCHSVCPVCDREFKHQNPANGWRCFIRELEDYDGYVCEACWIKEIVKEGADIDKMLREETIPTTFFGKSDFEDNGYEESAIINSWTVGSGPVSSRPTNDFFHKIKQFKEEGFFDTYKVLFDTESAAIGGFGAIITMWIKPKKWYRVFDTQTGCHFHSGYNAISIEDVIYDFKEYIRNGSDCPDGTDDMDEDEYDNYFDSLFDTWDKIADWLQGVVLEESETKFEDLD